MIVVNLKNYKIGKEVEELVQKIQIYYPNAIVAVPAINLTEIVKNINIEVYAQHVDHAEKGKGTGLILPESIVEAGAKGSLLNHSEHKMALRDIKKTVKRCNELSLKVIVCASSLKEAKSIKELNPYAIAFEDKTLIATGKSITEHKSEEISKFAELLKGTDIIPLCGAGITKSEDVAHALVLGCKGVLVSSAVANSQNPEKFLKDLSTLI